MQPPFPKTVIFDIIWTCYCLQLVGSRVKQSSSFQMYVLRTLQTPEVCEMMVRLLSHKLLLWLRRQAALAIWTHKKAILREQQGNCKHWLPKAFDLRAPPFFFFFWWQSGSIASEDTSFLQPQHSRTKNRGVSWRRRHRKF